MAFVQFSNLSVSYGERDLLKSVGLNLQTGSRAALTGANGSGKSTLMRIIAGLASPDTGDRAVQKDSRISYLPQSGLVHAGSTLLGEAEKAFAPLAALIGRMEETGRELAGRKEDDPRTKELLESYHASQEALENSGYYRREERIGRTLKGLGFSESDFDRPAQEFSGGWQMRIALAKVLLETPDILLLDEPTNYLDLEARNWLEEYLADFPGACLIVSHDRYFLDVTVNEVWELFNGRLTRYQGNFSAYEKRRSAELDQLFEAWERQQEEIQKLEDFIRRFRYNESKAAQVQSRIKQLEKIVPIEIPEGMKKIHFAFPPPPHSGNVAISMEELSKSYGTNRVLRGLNLTVTAGEKLALVGKNGAGKSTLMRMIAQADRDFDGTLRLGAGVTLGYFSQETSDSLEGSRTVEEELEAIAPTSLIPKLRGLLGAFLFRGDDIFKSVGVLSGGERSRLALLKLLLFPVNLLVLDEPTNHLDLTSKDVLLEALQSFDGTVIFVSHDRYFIEALATKVLELGGGAAKLYPGDYRYYLEKKERDSLPGSGNTFRTRDGGQPEGRKDSFRTREEEKHRKAASKKLERREEELLVLIESLEKEKAEIQYAMSLPGNYSDGARMRGLIEKSQSLDSGIEAATRKWEAVSAELASMEGEGGEFTAILRL